MVDEQNELLIDLVKERTCLWDLSSDTYKDKQQRAKAWAEIGEEIFDNFKHLSEKEKNDTCRKIQSKWKSMRDRYTRTKKECPFGTTNRKAYIYQKRLSFLATIHDNKATSSSLTRERTEIDPTYDASSTQGYVPKEETAKHPKKKKKDPIEGKIKDLIDSSRNKPSNDFVQFCESLYPNMSDFTEGEIFEVKSDLLDSIRKIKDRKIRIHEREMPSCLSTASGDVTYDEYIIKHDPL